MVCIKVNTRLTQRCGDIAVRWPGVRHHAFRSARCASAIA